MRPAAGQEKCCDNNNCHRGQDRDETNERLGTPSFRRWRRLTSDIPVCTRRSGATRLRRSCSADIPEDRQRNYSPISLRSSLSLALSPPSALCKAPHRRPPSATTVFGLELGAWLHAQGVVEHGLYQGHPASPTNHEQAAEIGGLQSGGGDDLKREIDGALDVWTWDQVLQTLPW